jgi:hypothetical protein
MGAWGTGVLSDDTVRDIYHDYLDLFNRGIPAGNIRTTILRNNRGTLRDVDEGPLVWIAIAKAQWDCGQLETEVLAEIRKIVQDGLGLDRWAEQGKRLLEQRKVALNQFLLKLETANERPRKPRRAIKRKPLFEPGDCVAARLQDGAWGAILVLQHEPESDDPYKETYGTNLVAALRYRSVEPPPLSVFEKREWLFLTHHAWRNRMELSFVFKRGSRSVKDRLVLVGNIPLRKTDPEYQECKTYCRWSTVLEEIYQQHRWDQGIRD